MTTRIGCPRRIASRVPSTSTVTGVASSFVRGLANRTRQIGRMTVTGRLIRAGGRQAFDCEVERRRADGEDIRRRERGRVHDHCSHRVRVRSHVRLHDPRAVDVRADIDHWDVERATEVLEVGHVGGHVVRGQVDALTEEAISTGADRREEHPTMLRVAQPQPDELGTDGAHFRTVEVRVGEVQTAGVELVRRAMDSLGTGAVVVTRRGVDRRDRQCHRIRDPPRACPADRIGSRKPERSPRRARPVLEDRQVAALDAVEGGLEDVGGTGCLLIGRLEGDDAGRRGGRRRQDRGGRGRGGERQRRRSLGRAGCPGQRDDQPQRKTATKPSHVHGTRVKGADS